MTPKTDQIDPPKPDADAIYALDTDPPPEPPTPVVIGIAIALAVGSLLAALWLNDWLDTGGRALIGDEAPAWASFVLGSASLAIFIWDTPGASTKKKLPKWWVRLGWKRPTAAVLAFLAVVQPAADIFFPDGIDWSPKFWGIFAPLGVLMFYMLWILWFMPKRMQENIREQDEKMLARLALRHSDSSKSGGESH